MYFQNNNISRGKNKKRWRYGPKIEKNSNSINITRCFSDHSTQPLKGIWEV